MAALIRMLDKMLIAPLTLAAASLRLRRPRTAPPQSGPVVAMKLVGMGDAVLMLPGLAAARASGRRLTVITSRRCSAVLGAPGVADEVIVFQRRRWWRHLRAIMRALRSCGTVLDYEQHVFWSAALAQLAPRRAERHGFRTRVWGRNRCYDVLVEPGAEPRPMKAIFDELARSAGLQPAAALVPLPVSAEARSTVEAWRRQEGLAAGGYVVMAPGSGATVGFRRLPASTWAEVAAGLALPVVLVGTRLEAALAAEIASLCPRPLLCRLDLRLEEVAALMAEAATVIATDSGPMHLAAAMGTPVVGIFGPDTPARYAPANPRSTSVSLRLPCSPCNNCWVYRAARCTNPDAYACVRRLPAAMVLAAAANLESGARGRMAAGAAGESAHNQG